MKVQSRLGVTVAGISPGHVAVTVNDGDTVNFTASGTDNQTITAEVVIDPAVDNITVATVDGVYTKLIDEVTYAELAALISGSDLIQGRQYLITDYQTVHTIPGTAATFTGPTEPLIVTATDTNNISPVAYSSLYPDDVIYYSHLNGNSDFAGSTKGFIYRRVDTLQNNDIGTDWRHCVYRRYKINQAVWDSGTTYAVGEAVKSTINNNIYLSLQNSNLNNVVTDADYWMLFPFANGSYRGLTGTTWVINPLTSITTDNLDFTDYTFFANAYSSIHVNNVVRTYRLMNTVALIHFRYNHVDDHFLNNTLLGFFEYNKIGNQFSDNVVGQTFQANVVANFFQKNIITSNFTASTIGHSCAENNIGSGQSNNIHAQFLRNSIGLSMLRNNIFSEYFQNNIILHLFRDNTISVSSVASYDFTGATHVYAPYSKNIVGTDVPDIRLQYVDNTYTITFAAVNA